MLMPAFPEADISRVRLHKAKSVAEFEHIQGFAYVNMQALSLSLRTSRRTAKVRRNYGFKEV